MRSAVSYTHLDVYKRQVMDSSMVIFVFVGWLICTLAESFLFRFYNSHSTTSLGRQLTFSRLLPHSVIFISCCRDNYLGFRPYNIIHIAYLQYTYIYINLKLCERNLFNKCRKYLIQSSVHLSLIHI